MKTTSANPPPGGCAARLAQGLWSDLQPFLPGLPGAEFRRLLTRVLRQAIGEAPDPAAAPISDREPS
ncbi:MAG: hypothetical protein V1797_08010 [Pseudomonadota bacterium]